MQKIMFRTAINICIRSKCYLPCRNNKDPLDPDLLMFEKDLFTKMMPGFGILAAVEFILSRPFWRVSKTLRKI